MANDNDTKTTTLTKVSEDYLRQFIALHEQPDDKASAPLILPKSLDVSKAASTGTVQQKRDMVDETIMVVSR